MTIRIPIGRRFRFVTMRCWHIICRDQSFHTAHLLVMTGRS